MMRPVLTATDLAGVADGGELTIAAGTLVTPLARDEAARRGITIRVAESPPPPGPEQHPIAIGSDHGGYELKEHLKTLLREWGYPVDDLGTDSTAAVDYPDFAEAVASAVARRRSLARHHHRQRRNRQLHRRQQGARRARGAML